MSVDIKDEIIEIIEKNNPKNIEELFSFSKDKLDYNEDYLRSAIIKMINNKTLSLTYSKNDISFKDFITSVYAYWFWSIMLVLTIFYISVFFSNIYKDFIFLRYILGGGVALFIPGFSLVMALFPKSDMPMAEKIALSVGISLAVTPLVSFLLNFTPWKISFTPIVISLTLLIIATSLIGSYTNYLKFKESLAL